MTRRRFKLRTMHFLYQNHYRIPIGLEFILICKLDIVHIMYYI